MKTRGKLELGWANKPSAKLPPALTAAHTEPAKQRRAKASGELVGINFRMNPDAWTQLGVLSAEQRRAKQDLLLEALDDLFVKYGKTPVARSKD